MYLFHPPSQVSLHHTTFEISCVSRKGDCEVGNNTPLLHLVVASGTEMAQSIALWVDSHLFPFHTVLSSSFARLHVRSCGLGTGQKAPLPAIFLHFQSNFSRVLLCSK